MALPASGAISLSEVNTELTFSASALISLNDSAVRGLFGVASGAISLNDGYGKAAGPTEPVWTSMIASMQATSFGTNYALYGVGFANGKYVFLTSTAGAYLTSTDLISFTPYTGRWASFANNYMVSNGSVFLSLSNSARIYRSTDAINWTEVGTALRATAWGSFTAVTKGIWDGTNFVIVGTGAHIAYSSDGITWTYVGGLRATSWGTSNPTSLRFENGKYVMVGPSAKMAYSTNITTWTYTANLQYSAWGSSSIVKDYAYGNGMNVIVGGNPSSRVWSGTEVIHVPFGSYQQRNISTLVGSSAWTDKIVWFNDRFILLIRSFAVSLQSTDGINWEYTSSSMAATGWTTANYEIRDFQILNGKAFAVTALMNAIYMS
jgi:hypothetical protein